MTDTTDASPVFARLVHLRTKKAYALLKDVVYIGRDAKQCQVIADYDDISSKQCVIRALSSSDGFLVNIIQDMSSNGTFIDGKRLARNDCAILRDGAVLSFTIWDSNSASENFGHFQARAYRFCIVHPQSFFANYDLQRILGSGGFGTVREARNRITRELHAVKTAKDPALLSATDAEMIHREVSILKQLRHSRIVRFDQVFQENNEIHIVMELIVAGDLHALIHSKHGIAEESAKIVTVEMCSALQYLHSKCIVHRDIKPKNVLVTSLAPIHVKVADFGLAKTFQGTVLQSVCGTMTHMAPEIVFAQLRSNGLFRPYDHKVDSWGVGVTLFEMLSASLPYVWAINGVMPRQYKDYATINWRPMPINVSVDVRDLITKLLVPMADARTSIVQAVVHQWCHSAHLREVAHNRAKEKSSPSDPSNPVRLLDPMPAPNTVRPPDPSPASKLVSSSIFAMPPPNIVLPPPVATGSGIFLLLILVVVYMKLTGHDI